MFHGRKFTFSDQRAILKFIFVIKITGFHLNFRKARFGFMSHGQFMKAIKGLCSISGAWIPSLYLKWPMDLCLSFWLELEILTLNIKIQK